VIRVRAIYSQIKKIKTKTKKTFFLSTMKLQNYLIWKTIPGYENYETFSILIAVV
jgi:hypothetical protein